MIKMKILNTTLLVIAICSLSFAQSKAPAEPQSKPIILMNGTAHLGNGEVIENSAISFDNGKIGMVVDATVARIELSKFEVISISGKHVYPGLILPNTELGLREVDAVNATIDVAEVGVIKPHVRSLIAYNTDSELTPTFRHNGVLLAQITPSGGVMRGTSSVVHLDGWNWEDAAVRVDDGIHVNWPNRKLPPRWWMNETEYRDNENYQSSIDEMDKLLKDAKAYQAGGKKETNVVLESVLGLFDGSKQLYIHENGAKDMIEAYNFAKGNGVKNIVLVGAKEAHIIVDFIKENNIPVILDGVHRLPTRTEEDVDLPFKLPAILHEAGVNFCLSYGSGDASSERNLAFMAGTAAAYGLDKEVALQLITSKTAGILGISDRFGTIESGKSATIVVSEGDIMDMRTNKVTHAYIDGRKVTLDGMQENLNEKYKKKYGHE